MAFETVNGLTIAYELIGEGEHTIGVTAGGRYSKDTPGMHELGAELAKAGYRTLIWDRPNCGESDLCFDAETESMMNTAALAGLLDKLDLGPVMLVGGSAGARISLMTAINRPDLVAGLFLLWVAGGPLGLAVLAEHYCFASAFAANTQGMHAVAELPAWQEQLSRNPGNRERMLAQDPQTFVDTMQRWAKSFFPVDDSPVPGLSEAQLGSIRVPTTILNSGRSDIHHPRTLTEALAKLIPGAKLDDPPWADTAWNDLLESEGMTMYRDWPLLAPRLVEHARNVWPR